MEREKLLEKIIVEAGKETLKFYGKAKVKYTKKNVEDVTTEADLRSEKIIVDAIKKHFPNDGIVSEESKDYNTNSEYVWIIYPLDGSWNFFNGIPLYAVLAAVAKKGELIVGGAYFPYFKEFYFAEKGMGAFLNKKKIFCSDKRNMEGLRSTGYMRLREENRKQMVSLLEEADKIKIWNTEFGCGAYDMALVASGKSHFFITPATGTNIWDIAAPAIIMKEAGCKVTTFMDRDWQPTEKTDVLAANPYLHGQLMNIMNRK
jgi:myo-inositol-1(or 4)-monophosphatase